MNLLCSKRLAADLQFLHPPSVGPGHNCCCCWTHGWPPPLDSDRCQVGNWWGENWSGNWTVSSLHSSVSNNNNIRVRLWFLQREANYSVNKFWFFLIRILHFSTKNVFKIFNRIKICPVKISLGLLWFKQNPRCLWIPCQNLKKEKKTNPLSIHIYISVVSGAESSMYGGLYFIWVLQLTAVFHKAIWLCVYKRKVRVGQEILVSSGQPTLV